MPDLITPHPMADRIPTGNVISIPALRGAAATEVLEQTYNADTSAFQGSFCAANNETPTWAADVARYDRDAFHKDSPNRIKFFADVKGLKAGDAECYANFRFALDLWIKGGRKGPMPYSEAQDYGSCVNASFAALVTMLLGIRASDPQYKEIFEFAAAWYHYANRGYCSDGWSMWGLAKVAYAIGIAFRRKYTIGSFSTDFTNDDTNERIVARDWCRSGVPRAMADDTQANHPFEDGALTEFTGGLKELLQVFANGGGINTGGTNTSGGSRPFVIGRVGGHEQCGYGADNSEEFRKHCQDVFRVKPRDNDFPIIMDQTWGPGFSGSLDDDLWPVGTAADGNVVTMGAIKRSMRAAAGPDEMAAIQQAVDALVLSGTWGWGIKPEGAWVWWASDILRYFDGDIFAVLPRFKGVADPNPTPVPVPVPTPVPNPVPNPAPSVIEVEFKQPVPAGRYILFPKAIV